MTTSTPGVLTDEERAEICARIDVASIASCNCDKKTHEIKYHSITCAYRLLEEYRLRLTSATTEDRAACGTLRSWVKCPVCSQPDMECVTDIEGDKIIECTNHACKSNGGAFEAPTPAAQVDPRVAEIEKRHAFDAEFQPFSALDSIQIMEALEAAHTDRATLLSILRAGAK